jgi:magnesium-transporting ATPase (P-type)
MQDPGATVGLTSAEVGERLRRDGLNTIPKPRRRSVLRIMLGELTHFFALLLWAAAALAWIAGMPALTVAVVAVIVLNAVFSFVQQARADRAAERLSALLPSYVLVVRDGRRQRIEASGVVVDDHVVLRPGDRVPGDGALTRTLGLEIDTSMLTGESVPEAPDDGSRAWAGTFVVAGEGEMDVERIGRSTRLAEITKLATVGRPPITPLTRELRRVVRLIAILAVSIGALFFAVTLLLGDEPSQGIVFAVGVTVALVPEALLPTVTLTLAWGAERMARRNVLVRNLEAVETLGSTTIICTDKTGTLTRNEMTVMAAWTPRTEAHVDHAGYEPDADVLLTAPEHGAAVQDLATAAVRCSDGYAHRVDGVWRPHGDPMEAALDVFARRLGLDTDGLRAQGTRAHFPFDPRRRMMSVLAGGDILVKGAPDALLARCADTGAAAEIVDRMTSEGLRVIGVASRHWQHSDVPHSSDEVERDLTLLGLVGLEDPPREEVPAAIAACRDAQVSVIMVTGDHPVTAAAIATEIGLRPPDGLVLVGAQLPDDEAAVAELVQRSGTVVARVSPEDKLRIARALRSAGHVVAMTGDGVNDVPALEEADIGIAMGASGTDVAREAADLVLLDDRFSSIVAGIEQGRATYANIRRFLTYHLTDNVAEVTPFLVWGLSGGSFPLALGVLQIIALDIGTDTLSAVALGAEPPSRNVLRGPPNSGRLLNRTVLLRAFGLLGPTIAVMTMAAFVATFLGSGWRVGEPFPSGSILLAASGAAFMAVVLGQTANAFACRSATRTPWSLGWGTNRLLIPAASIELAFSLVVIFVTPVAIALSQAPPTPFGWLLALMAIPVLWMVDATSKALRRRHARTAPVNVSVTP